MPDALQISIARDALDTIAVFNVGALLELARLGLAMSTIMLIGMAGIIWAQAADRSGDRRK